MCNVLKSSLRWIISICCTLFFSLRKLGCQDAFAVFVIMLMPELDANRSRVHFIVSGPSLIALRSGVSLVPVLQCTSAPLFKRGSTIMFALSKPPVKEVTPRYKAVSQPQLFASISAPYSMSNETIFKSTSDTAR